MSDESFPGPEPNDAQLAFRLSPSRRVAFMAIGVVGTVFFAVLAIQQAAPLAVLFCLCTVMVLLEGLRSEVRVDPTRGEVTSTRAIRRTTLRISDIENVRVPPWGPIALTLREEVRTGGKVQVLTGLYSARQSNDGEGNRLADALGVPVVSVWSGARSDKGPESGGAR